MSKRKQRPAMAAWTKHARSTSPDAARALALSIVHGQSPGFQAYDLGIVLKDSETAWQRVHACYRYRGEQSWMVQHNSYHGHRGTLSEVRQPCMFSVGPSDGLIINQRLATRLADATVLSIYWSAVQAVSVDLEREFVVLDGAPRALSCGE